MIRATLDAATRRLASSSSSPRLDAELLLAHVLGVARARLTALDDQALAPAEVAAFDSVVGRRAAGEPVAYLVGRKDFWTLTLAVDRNVLVPRPETELLVELSLAAVRGRRQPRVLDLGTGSGAIGLALASERPDARVDLADASPAALAVAELNRRTLGAANARTLLGEWFAPVAGLLYDVVVSNPPYLASDDPHLGSPDLAHEPRVALVSGASGLEAIAAIARAAPAHLDAGGMLIVEHGAMQGEAVRARLLEHGFRGVVTHRDLAGLERATKGTRPD